MAKGRGTVTDPDVFGYQCDMQSGDDLAGYDELIDMSEVGHIAMESVDRVRELASLAASTDSALLGSRLAIVAPKSLAFGLGRMFATFRELDLTSRKHVEVFRSVEEALAFLGVKTPP